VRYLPILLTLLLLGAPATAQEIATIKFEVYPPDARVESLNERLEWDTLGHVNDIIKVDVDKYTLFRFTASGYEPREESISEKAFNTQDGSVGKWPSSGTLELRPLPITRAKQFLLRFGWLLLIPVPLIGVIRRLRREAKEKEDRVAYLEKLQNEAQQSKDTVLGQRLGKYLLTGFLGKGGMAVVYRGVAGTDHKTGEQVAVKVLSSVDDEQTVQRFHREVQICQKLIHPNIVALHDWGQEGDLIYLAMELIQGGSLEAKMKSGIEFPEAVEIFDQILAGMDFAHSQGVTHRDLKPDNIMLTDNDRVKITDFGLAKLQSIRTVTVTGSVMGTPAYMAPEQIQGEEPTPAMDQYALGVLGYQLFTGKLPFESEDMMVVITRHLVEEPPHPKTIKEDLPDEISSILLKMLEKEPDDRFPDLEAVRRALKALKTLPQ
jgi:hypothetical protein